MTEPAPNSRYQKAKEIFHRARHLDRELRAAYLDTACDGDQGLRDECESLLAYHASRTVLIGDTPNLPDDPPPGSLRRATSVVLAGAQHTSPLVRTVRAQRRWIVVGLLALLALSAGGFWTRTQVEDNIQRLLSDHLVTILKADVLALEHWLSAVESDAEMWADHHEVRAAVFELMDVRDDSDDPDTALMESDAQKALQVALADALKEREAVGPTFRTHRRFDAYGVVDEDGKLLGGLSPTDGLESYVGAQLNSEGMTVLGRVLEGNTVIVPPFPHGSLIQGKVPSYNRAAMFVAVPVRDDDSKPVALLSLLIEPSEEFAEILEVARPGETGETYAFDSEGHMLSESAFLDELHDIGLLGPDDTSAVFKVQLRDPGVDLTAGETPGLALADRPRTFMAQRAIDERNEAVEVDVAGYRDYRGVMVAGAWVWLERYDFGVVTEIDQEEGFQAIDSLKTSIRLLVGLLLAVGLGMLALAWKNLRLQTDIARALRYGEYTVDRLLGEGGIGSVYLAHHSMLKRPTAVKVLKPGKVTREAQQRFELEVQATAALTHPNTIEIFDYGKTGDDDFYYAMEYLPGLTLDKLIDRCGALPQARAVHILRQICGSLEEAHSQGLIHRDIKPMNIILCERGGRADVVKVLDFGLVKDLGAPKDKQVTAPQEVSGSPLYMSPERFEDPDAVDARADIWAVGCVGYYLLTARDAFSAKTVMEIWKLVVNDEPRPLRKSAPTEVVPELERILLRCLAKDPAKRPQTIGEVLDVLDALPIQPWTRDDARTWWNEHWEPEQDAAQQA